MQRLYLPILLLVTALALPAAAGAQALAVHQAASASAKSGTAAPPKASTIIPGSPLAAIAGAAPPPSQSAQNPPSPFGTGDLGLSVTNLISRETSGTVHDFIAAIQKSTELTPVWHWLGSFPANPARVQNAQAIAEGLLIAALPALILQIALRLLLARPRAGLVNRAAKLRNFSEPPSTASGLEADEADEVEEPPDRRESIISWFRRLLLAVMHFVLCLVPVLAFALAAGAMLGLGFVTARDARLAVVGVSNAYLFCRLVLEAERFLAAPWTPPLRLFRMPNNRTVWLNHWVRILLATGGFSYAIVSISEILGLPRNGAMAVTRVLVLAIHIELAVMIWQSRKLVGGWIRGRRNSESVLAPLRARLALVWHYVALFYVLALWVAWAGGVHNAFVVLLRVVLFFIAAIVLGRVSWRGSEILLDRLFPDPIGLKTRHANFFSRARVYTPLIKTIIRIVIGIAMVVVILLGWGINVLPRLLKDPVSRGLLSAFIAIIITVAIALIIWEIANGALDGRIHRLTAAGKTRQALRLRTLSPILKATFGTGIGLLAGLICLSKIGVNAAPLLAGAGVLGIAIGFGSQKLVQDIITGLFLLLEDTMQVGDVVTLGGMSGTVERLSIRTIRLRGGDGSVNIVPFSSVTIVTNQTRDFGTAQISIGVGYNEDIDRVCAVLMDISKTMRAEPIWGPMMRDDLQINGLDQFGASALIITGQIRTGPGQHWTVRREFSRRMLLRFAQERIDIPYTAAASTVMAEKEEPSFSEEKEAKRLLETGIQAAEHPGS